MMDRRIDDYEPWELWTDGDEEEDDKPHRIDCGCEDCMQNYPERFDDEGENIYYVEPDPTWK
jgi:hypothetical protein